MRVLKIGKQQFKDGLGRLQPNHRLVGPVKKGGFHSFRPLAAGEMPDFDLQNTRLSPKSAVQPQSQKMFTYSLDECQPDHHLLKPVEKDAAPQVILGIRPCDAYALLLVRRNFASDRYQDPYWLEAFEATTRVGLACHRPCSSCFCTTAGCGPFHEAGLDILLVDQEDHFLAEVLTSKGEALAQAAGWNAEIEEGQAQAKIGAMRQAAEGRIDSRIQTDQLRNQDTLTLYDAPFWEDVAFSCINCGTCTYLCPTCWCFDIQDENRGLSGVRMRNWDSCMFPLFTLHGTGHNPRGVKLQRVRQRFMHKLKYYVDKYDNGIACVGCGRCVRFCPVNIDIRRVCDLMNSYSAAQACEVK